MANPVKPGQKRAFARDRWFWVPAIADLDEPELDEITALAAFNMSCVMLSAQEQPTATTEKVQLPLTNCETETTEVSGATQHSIPDFMLYLHPQAAALSDGKKAWEAFDDLANGFLVRCQDSDPNTDVEAGDFIDIWPGQLTVKVPTKTSTGADSVYAFSIGVSATGAPHFNVAILDTP